MNVLVRSKRYTNELYLHKNTRCNCRFAENNYLFRIYTSNIITKVMVAFHMINREYEVETHRTERKHVNTHASA